MRLLWDFVYAIKSLRILDIPCDPNSTVSRDLTDGLISELGKCGDGSIDAKLMPSRTSGPIQR